MKILVTGASGHFGTAAIKHLLSQVEPSTIFALVREASKGEALKAQGVQIRVGNYDDLESLKSAFAGIDKLLFVSGSDIEARIPQHENVVRAAQEAGVQQVVYTGVLSDDIGGVSPIEFVEKAHRLTGELLRSSGLSYTILGNSLYADIIPQFAGEQLLQTKTLFFPAGEGKTSFATRDNMAEAAANVLADETDQYVNQFIEITGAEAISWQQIADAITEIIGVQITYVSPAPEAYEEVLKQAQLPASVVAMLSGFAQAMAQGYFQKVTADLEDLLGRKPDSVKSYLTSVYGK